MSRIVFIEESHGTTHFPTLCDEISGPPLLNGKSSSPDSFTEIFSTSPVLHLLLNSFLFELYPYETPVLFRSGLIDIYLRDIVPPFVSTEFSVSLNLNFNLIYVIFFSISPHSLHFWLYFKTSFVSGPGLPTLNLFHPILV